MLDDYKHVCLIVEEHVVWSKKCYIALLFFHRETKTESKLKYFDENLNGIIQGSALKN